MVNNNLDEEFVVAVFPFGSLKDPKNIKGMVHLCEHLILKVDLTNKIIGYTDFDKMVLLSKNIKIQSFINFLDRVFVFDDKLFNNSNFEMAKKEVLKEILIKKECIEEKKVFYNSLDKDLSLPVGNYNQVKNAKILDVKEFLKQNLTSNYALFSINKNNSINLIRKISPELFDNSYFEINNNYESTIVYRTEISKNRVILFNKINYINNTLYDKLLRTIYSNLIISYLKSKHYVDIEVNEKIITKNQYYLILDINIKDFQTNLDLIKILDNMFKDFPYISHLFFSEAIEIVSEIIRTNIQSWPFDKFYIMNEIINQFLYNEYPLISRKEYENCINLLKQIAHQDFVHYYADNLNKNVLYLTGK